MASDIERNPVRAGLVALPWKYPWSSAGVRALGRDDPLLTRDPVPAMVDDWRAFLAVDPDEALQAELRSHSRDDVNRQFGVDDADYTRWQDCRQVSPVSPPGNPTWPPWCPSTITNQGDHDAESFHSLVCHRTMLVYCLWHTGGHRLCRQSNRTDHGGDNTVSRAA